MRFKILVPGDENLLLEFLLWLTPEALDTWFAYGKIFDIEKVKNILKDSNSLRIAGIDKVKQDVAKSYSIAPKRERIVVFGHLYDFTKNSCRLGIVAGITGKGYGTQMMKVLISFAKASGCKKLCLSSHVDNYPALALYKKFKFRIIQKYTDKSRHKYEMVKDL